MTDFTPGQRIIHRNYPDVVMTFYHYEGIYNPRAGRLRQVWVQGWHPTDPHTLDWHWEDKILPFDGPF